MLTGDEPLPPGGCHPKTSFVSNSPERAGCRFDTKDVSAAAPPPRHSTRKNCVRTTGALRIMGIKITRLLKQGELNARNKRMDKRRGSGRL